MAVQLLSRFFTVLRAPQAVPAAGFLAVILVGSLLLSLPWSHEPGAVSYLDALFTSTSAVCVTGLVTVNTAHDFTVAGQVVILLLIQIGGLGVLAYAAMAYSLLGRRLSLRTQAAIRSSLFQQDAARDFRRRLKQILTLVVGAEGVGTLVLFFTLLPQAETGAAAWSAVFHTISAFCNAGFSILPDNLAGAGLNGFSVGIIAVLIILGGLGLVVLSEIWGELKRVVGRRPFAGPRRFTLHTQIVLVVSLLLIVGGAGLMLLFGQTGDCSWPGKVGHAFFQSISARTAGFNTLDIGALPLASLMILTVLMFIGGSPGSFAGGIKTTSVAVLFARMRSYLVGQEVTRLLGRSVNRDIVRSVGLLLLLAVLWNLAGVLVLAHFEMGRRGVELQHLLFEQISAFGTVGLSTDTTTAGLSAVGKIWIIATMYVGRLGPLTLASLAIYRRSPRVGFPEGKVMIG
jgi:trk system potassium uptake protein